MEKQKRNLIVEIKKTTLGKEQTIILNGNKVTTLNKNGFSRFVKNMGLLHTIRNNAFTSIYALAKAEKKDVANISKVVNFYEKIGVLKMKVSTVTGRKVKAPVMEIDQIIFKINQEARVNPRKTILRISRRR